MKKVIFAFYFSFFVSCIVVTQNLVPNYSFEKLSSCPGNLNLSQIHKAIPWFRATAGTSDVFNICSIDPTSNVPANGFGNQIPRIGNGYCGFYTQVGNNREYIETKMTLPLVINRKYCVVFYVSLADTMQRATSSIGVYLSKDTIMKDTLGNTLPLNMYTPQIQNPAGNFITDKDNWVPISGVYTAQGGERFITIGNFNDDANTPIQIVSTGTEPWSYYYIDDVSVVELPEATELTGGDKVICPGDSVLLGAAQKMNVSYSWQGSDIVGSSSGSWQVWAKPSATTTYTLTVRDTSVVCANSSVAVVTVEIKQLAIGSTQFDTTICEGKNIIIGNPAKQNYTYTWSPSATLNNPNIAQPIAFPRVTTTYYVTAQDTNYGFSCNKVTDSVKITVINCDTVKPNSFWVPTAFSPNGDNNNDVLYVYGKNVKELEFAVYNRWGEKIYEGRFTMYDLKSGGFETWDGKYKNEGSEQGIYVWQAKVKFKDGEEKNVKGSITLLR